MNDKFILLGKEKAFLVYFEQYIVPSFPKNEKQLRTKIIDEYYEMIKNTTKVSVNKGNIRQKYINDIKSNIMMIDFYLEVIFTKKLIIKKRFLSCVKMLGEIRNIIYSLDYKDEKN